MRTALLIGGTGFVGQHMQRSLRNNFKVVATGRSYDIKDADKIKLLVKNVNPSLVVNFASVTTVKESFQDPLNTFETGFIGTLNLLMGLKENSFQGRMLNISSSEVYGITSRNQFPIREEAVISPISPYSVGKIATEALCYQWSKTEQFDIITARSFTHFGPGQSEKFSISHFAKQIAEILIGIKEPVIFVGDLSTTRDFTDVRDVVHAYSLLLDRGRSGQIYNVCSGIETSTWSLLNELIKYSGIQIKVKQDDSLIRNTEQRHICGSYEKINIETGWKPRIPLSRTLADSLSYWVEKLK